MFHPGFSRSHLVIDTEWESHSPLSRGCPGTPGRGKMVLKREVISLVTEADLRLLPAKPGVYLMRGAQDEVLYVGKARSLRNRVRSYFQEARPLDPRIQLMVSQIARFEFITTASEVEALALESNLIKEHHPKYNVKLRDDKQYPLLKVTWEEDYPQLLIVRRIKDDGARYFGPYTDSGALRDTLRLLRRLFPLRSCKTQDRHRPRRPSLPEPSHPSLPGAMRRRGFGRGISPHDRAGLPLPGGPAGATGPGSAGADGGGFAPARFRACRGPARPPGRPAQGG